MYPLLLGKVVGLVLNAQSEPKTEGYFLLPALDGPGSKGSGNVVDRAPSAISALWWEQKAISLHPIWALSRHGEEGMGYRPQENEGYTPVWA
jgi:hypothetical protein